MAGDLFLSFGGGVQTTALYLAYEKGLLKEKPKTAIFADTQAEPEHIYSHIDFLKTKSKIPIIKATRGSIIETTKKYKYSQAPVYGLKKNGVKVDKVMGRRSCTYYFKISVVYREIRKLTKTVKKRLPENFARVALGISTDEFAREHPSRDKWVQNTFPLLYDLKWSRKDCIDFVMEELGVIPKKSACYMCPYMSNKQWKDLRDNQPNDWKKAIDYDELIRNLNPNVQNFIHRDRIPLKEANLDSDAFQPDFFKTECMGGCGL